MGGWLRACLHMCACVRVCMYACGVLAHVYTSLPISLIQSISCALYSCMHFAFRVCPVAYMLRTEYIHMLPPIDLSQLMIFITS